MQNADIIVTEEEQVLLNLQKEMDILRQAVAEIQSKIEDLQSGGVTFEHLKGTYDRLLASRFILEDEESIIAGYIGDVNDLIQEIDLSTDEKTGQIQQEEK